MCRKAVHTVSEGGWHAARHSDRRQRAWEPCDHLTTQPITGVAAIVWLMGGVTFARTEYEHTGTLLLPCELSRILTLAVLRFALICRFLVLTMADGYIRHHKSGTCKRDKKNRRETNKKTIWIHL